MELCNHLSLAMMETFRTLTAALLLAKLMEQPNPTIVPLTLIVFLMRFATASAYAPILAHQLPIALPAAAVTLESVHRGW
jgi:hypothetical protein